MTAPWSGSEVAAGEDELGEGVGSSEGVASTVGAALGLADALGVVAATVGVVVAGVVVCWRDRAVAAAHPRAGTITRMARKGHYRIRGSAAQVARGECGVACAALGWCHE